MKDFACYSFISPQPLPCPLVTVGVKSVPPVMLRKRAKPITTASSLSGSEYTILNRPQFDCADEEGQSTIDSQKCGSDEVTKCSLQHLCMCRQGTNIFLCAVDVML